MTIPADIGSFILNNCSHYDFGNAKDCSIGRLRENVNEYSMYAELPLCSCRLDMLQRINQSVPSTATEASTSPDSRSADVGSNKDGTPRMAFGTIRTHDSCISNGAPSPETKLTLV